jgi:hypothetical protein
MIQISKKQIEEFLQKFNHEKDLKLIQYHIERSVSISWIKQAWENFYSEFIFKKCIYSNVTHEYEGYNTLKFTTLIHDDLLYWWNEIKYSIRFFRIDHIELAKSSGLSTLVSTTIYNYHFHVNFNLKSQSLSNCKKMTYDDWRKILAFVRKTFYILHQLNKEKPMTIDGFKNYAVSLLEKIVKKHSVLIIQFHIRIFLFKRKRARKVLCNFILENAFLPGKILYKYYKKDFYKLSFFQDAISP